MRLRKGLVSFIVIIQSLLFVAHFFVYETWMFSSRRHHPSPWLAVVLGLLSLSFISASLLAYRYNNPLVRAFYRAAAIWAGCLSFLFFATACVWIIFAGARLTGLTFDFHRMVEFSFGTAILFSVYAVFNANWTRVTRISVQLANLPDAWRGRKAALISDLHLGPVRNGGFLRRMIRKVLQEAPDAIFIAGDLYDGTAIDAARAAKPLSQLNAPQGVYFVAGNHEQFGDDSKFLTAVSAAGVRVLSNEKVEVDGLQIVGVPYRHAARMGTFASVLRAIGLDRSRASILLTHSPDHPAIAEAAGFSLQLSGHTHLGQFIPWNWMAQRIYRQFVYGLSRIGRMQVFTSSGAGTWGPPLRLGSNPEIVMLEFV
jgi:uncharacterized protein